MRGNARYEGCIDEYVLYPYSTLWKDGMLQGLRKKSFALLLGNGSPMYSKYCRRRNGCCPRTPTSTALELCRGEGQGVFVPGGVLT